jgi:hypothetical protein
MGLLIVIRGIIGIGWFQLLVKGNIWKTDLTRLAISTAAGAIGGGIGSALGKGGALLKGVGLFTEHALVDTGLGLGGRTLINAGVGFNTGYWGKVAENGLRHQELTEGALFTGLAGGVGAGAGELLGPVIEGIGAKFLNKFPAPSGISAIRDIVGLTDNISWDVIGNQWTNGESKAFVKRLLDDEATVAMLKQLDRSVIKKSNHSVKIEVNTIDRPMVDGGIIRGYTDRDSDGKIIIQIFEKNHDSVDSLIETIKHESLHGTYKGTLPGTKYEEYLARVRAVTSLHDGKWHRPTLSDRREIWDKVLTDYSELSVGKTPSAFLRSLDD